MAQCVVISEGQVVQATGTVQDCTGFLLLTREEFAQSQGVLVPLSIAEGSTIGAAIFAVWAVAFGFRLLRKLLDDVATAPSAE